MSTLVPPLFNGLVDDASLLPPSFTGLSDAVTKHDEHRTSWFAGLLGPLLVPASMIGVEIPAGELPVALVGDVPVSAVPVAVEKLRSAGAVVFHLRRKEIQGSLPAVALTIMAVVVAWGRFGAWAF